MRQQLLRRLFAAAAGVIVLSAPSFAQAPIAPRQLPQIPMASPVTPVSGTGGVIAGSGGCTNCGTGKAGYAMVGGNGYYHGNCGIGQPSCNAGCGSLKQDCNFFFGSCRQFFAPCGVDSSGGIFGGKCGGLFGGKCNSPATGRGATSGFNTCTYDSYLNH